MNYVIDAFHRPPLVVTIEHDVQKAAELAQRYADQAGRAIVLASGPEPVEAQFLPTVPEVSPQAVVPVEGPVLAPSEVDSVTEEDVVIKALSSNEPKLTERERDILRKRFGL